MPSRAQAVIAAAVVVGASAIGLVWRFGTRTARPSPTTTALAAEPARAAGTPHGVQGDGGSAQPSGERTSKGRELPRGGRVVFPEHRLVGFCGTRGAPKLGRLSGNLAARAKTVEGFAETYAQGRKPLPVFELIAVIAQEAPGAEGLHRRRVPDATVESYLAAARAARALLLLNIQPGHSDFATEVKHFERFLREPDVGVALDPEWAMAEREGSAKRVPGASFGRMRGRTVTDIARYLRGIVAEGDLPEKVLVFHQVNERVLVEEEAIEAQPGVAIVKSIDGLGRRESKIKTYDALVRTLSPGVHPGFKLFFDEDSEGGHRLMTPEQVLSLTPVPAYVMYE